MSEREVERSGETWGLKRAAPMPPMLALYRSRFGVDELSARLDEAGREIAALKAEIVRLSAEAARRDWPVGDPVPCPTGTGRPDAPGGAWGGPTP